ncbi:MAG: hypothetical protein AAFW75_00070 [Cyanobacteria bacterium J06636_16]
MRSLFIDRFGWRGAWLGLAAFAGLGMGTIGWLFYRDNPEECGLWLAGCIASKTLPASAIASTAATLSPAYVSASTPPAIAIAPIPPPYSAVTL